jgi:peptide/nickel transport system permease protein
VLAGEAGAARLSTSPCCASASASTNPLVTQLASCVWAVNLDLSFSSRHNTTVLQLMLDRLPATLILIGTSLSRGGARRQSSGDCGPPINRPADGAIAVVLLRTPPTFWIGLMLIVLFSVKLGWLPTGGIDHRRRPSIGRVLDVAPPSCPHDRSPSSTRRSTRLMRASCSKCPVRTMSAPPREGHQRGACRFAHALATLLPLLTMVGVQVGSLLGGSVLVESVFGWPGLGRLAFEAVQQRDYNLLLGILLMSSLLVIVVNLVIDLLYAVLDPRIELR